MNETLAYPNFCELVVARNCINLTRIFFLCLVRIGNSLFILQHGAFKFLKTGGVGIAMFLIWYFTDLESSTLKARVVVW